MKELRCSDQARADFLRRIREVAGLNFLQPINAGLALARVGVAQDLFEIVQGRGIKHGGSSIR